MIDDMGGISPTILLGWAVAVLLFLLALHAAAGAGMRRGAGLTLAGMAAVGAVTLYSHDVMNLPEICGMLIIGGGAGWLAGREVSASSLPALLIGLAGLAGLAGLFIAVALWRNPHAFGLLDKGGDMLSDGAVRLLRLEILLALMTIAGSFSASGRGGSGAALTGGRCLSAVLLALASASTAFMPEPHPLLLVGGGIAALLAGHMFALWSAGGGSGATLALLVSLLGWAGVVIGFLVENPVPVVAGGLAGTAGGSLALRLCGKRGRKGLADAKPHP